MPVNVKDSLGNTLTTAYVDQKPKPGDDQDETRRWREVIGTFMNFPASWTTISPQILSGEFGYG